MRQRNPLVCFLGSFALWCGLFMLPWPGFNAAYGGYFRGLARQIFAEDGEGRAVRFEAAPMQGTRALDTRIVVDSLESADPAIHRRVKVLELDSRAVGWVPTAFVLALILATPFPWRRRGWAVIWGGLAIQVFVLFAVAVYILSETGQVHRLSLDGWPAIAKVVVDSLEETLITQMGAGFVVPVAVWIGVMFRRGDFKFLLDAIQGAGSGPR